MSERRKTTIDRRQNDDDDMDGTLDVVSADRNLENLRWTTISTTRDLENQSSPRT